MVYLITGGTGHVGARITRDLVREGHRVVVYEMIPDHTRLEGLLNTDERSMVQMVKGDVLDFEFLMETIKANGVDSIIHLAAVLFEAIKVKPRWATMVNADGTLNVFEAARLLGLTKVVWASSNAVFAAGAPSEEPTANDAPHYPWGPYGAAKSFGERISDFYFEEYGVDITATRYGGFIYGALQERGGSGTITRQVMLNPAVGKAGVVPWGDDTVGWIYVDDAARAAVLACKHRRVKRGAFNIPGHVHLVREVVGFVKEIIPEADIKVEPGKMAFATGWKLDGQAAEEEFGYRPLWSIKQGIRETINMERRLNGLPQI